MRFPLALGIAGALTVICSPTLQAQAPLGAGTWSSQLQPMQLQRDFDVLRSALEEAHGALYRFGTKPQLAQHFQRMRARLDRAMTRPEFLSVLNETVARIGDGHARFLLDDSTSAQLGRAPLLPLRAALDGERLVITANDSPADSVLQPGMEIITINDRSVRQLAERIVPTMPRDGFIETGRRRQFGNNFPQLFWLYADRASHFDVVAKDARGHKVRVALEGVQDSVRRRVVNPVNAHYLENFRALDGPPQNVSLRPARGSDVPVLRIRGFGGERFRVELDSVISIVRASNSGSLILDLRGNGGGVDMYGAYLVSKFLDKPFRYFDYIHLESIAPTFATWKQGTFDETKEKSLPDPKGGYRASSRMHPGIDVQQPSSEPFLGTLVVLIDGGTFSTAADVTAMLRSANRATFIGEETAGAYEGNTSGLNADVQLPTSGLKFRVQMFGYYNAVRPMKRGRGTLPDKVVPRRVSDVLSGRDMAMEHALAVLRAP